MTLAPQSMSKYNMQELKPVSAKERKSLNSYLSVGKDHQERIKGLRQRLSFYGSNRETEQTSTVSNYNSITQKKDELNSLVEQDLRQHLDNFLRQSGQQIQKIQTKTAEIYASFAAPHLSSTDSHQLLQRQKSHRQNYKESVGNPIDFVQ